MEICSISIFILNETGGSLSHLDIYFQVHCQHKHTLVYKSVCMRSRAGGQVSYRARAHVCVFSLLLFVASFVYAYYWCMCFMLITC